VSRISSGGGTAGFVACRVHRLSLLVPAGLESLPQRDATDRQEKRSGWGLLGHRQNGPRQTLARKLRQREARSGAVRESRFNMRPLAIKEMQERMQAVHGCGWTDSQRLSALP